MDLVAEILCSFTTRFGLIYQQSEIGVELVGYGNQNKLCNFQFAKLYWRFAQLLQGKKNQWLYFDKLREALMIFPKRLFMETTQNIESNATQSILIENSTFKKFVAQVNGQSTNGSASTHCLINRTLLAICGVEKSKTF